ncbi:hypothetical protein BD413DRAFT_129358 [Trametes elegans]|nr:hypothetical protein BD413DRAFT_129358 [Trametes elegans]
MVLLRTVLLLRYFTPSILATPRSAFGCCMAEPLSHTYVTTILDSSLPHVCVIAFLPSFVLPNIAYHSAVCHWTMTTYHLHLTHSLLVHVLLSVPPTSCRSLCKQSLLILVRDTQARYRRNCGARSRCCSQNHAH